MQFSTIFTSTLLTTDLGVGKAEYISSQTRMVNRLILLDRVPTNETETEQIPF